MTQVSGIPYRRHGPTAALREFLDPLDPGSYFDCGRARLHGLDDALLAEARRRDRPIGDDSFLLVATDMGLIYCRPSISFAIAARWEDLALVRPRGDDPVVLPVSWPRHGELKFTVSKRLAGNIFRRWLQLRMQATRQAREAQARALARNPSLPAIDLAAGPLAADDGPERASLAGERTGRTVSLDPATTNDPARFLLQDGELERLAVPGRAARRPAWVGSAVSMVGTVVVLSTAVLALAVAVSVSRNLSDDGGSVGSAVASAPPSTVDHQRFRPGERDVGVAGASADIDLAIGDESSSAADGPAAPSTSSTVDPSQLQVQTIDPESQLLTSPAGPSSSIASPAPPTSATGSLRCNSNYGGCVPDVDPAAGPDVDCVGQGDGPIFVDTDVVVLGQDVYGLDTDGDGLACEADQPPTTESASSDQP